MERIAVQTDRAPEPVGPYSQAISAGEFVFCSGQIALDPVSGTLVKGDIRLETTRVMENINEVLRSAGCSLGTIIKTTIYIRNMDDFPKINEVYGSYFNEKPPARATIQVARLPKDAHVEIECIAIVDKK